MSHAQSANVPHRQKMLNLKSTNLQVVANYFGVNGTFQLLPAFNIERFTLKGRSKTPTELSEKSCKYPVLNMYAIYSIPEEVHVLTNDDSKQVV